MFNLTHRTQFNFKQSCNRKFKEAKYKYQPLNFQHGSTTVEYSIVSLVVITVLFVPLGGEGSLSGVGLILQGLRSFQMHTTLLLSMP